MPPVGKKSESKSFEGYIGIASELLTKSGAKMGSKVEVRTKDGFEALGLLIPRYEGGGEHIVLKLKSGYNIGIDASSVSSINEIEPPLIETSPVGTMVETVNHMVERTVLLLSTGGTIASRVDYRTGAVKPAYTATDLYSSVPELSQIARMEPEVVFSALSENLSQAHWTELSNKIVEKAQTKSKFDGIVVMLGTDTLAYVSAALSFSLLGFGYPVVCVGSQRSSDRPSADSALNLQAAARFAAYSTMRGVFVAMHKTENDDVIAIHSGVRVRKNHTSRRDAFDSIDVPLVAEVNKEQITHNSESHIAIDAKRLPQDLLLKSNFDTNVFLLRFYPGFDPSFLEFLAKEKKAKGLIIEGTGLGHVSSVTVQMISDLVRKGIFVGITSQCIWGHVDLNVYETGIDLISAGAVSLGNMLSETAFVKLAWLIGNFPMDRVQSLMTRNLVGEISERLPLKESSN